MPEAAVQLSDEAIEAVAERVVELLRGEPITAGLVDAAEVARRFAVTRQYVYENAERLGAVRLGDGPRARLRFDLERVVEVLAPATLEARQRMPDNSRPARRPRRSSSSVALLPIGAKRVPTNRKGAPDG